MKDLLLATVLMLACSALAFENGSSWHCGDPGAPRCGISTKPATVICRAQSAKGKIYGLRVAVGQEYEGEQHVVLQCEEYTHAVCRNLGCN